MGGPHPGGGEQDRCRGGHRGPAEAHLVSLRTRKSLRPLSRQRTLGSIGRIGDSRMKLKLDLHDIYNRGQDIDRALRDIIDEAVRKKAPVVEIIPGKGSGQLKKHVLRFLQQKEIKALYHRVEKDSKNFGRLFVHFRW
jgi:DNA-nicking Smr family endonuclease